MSKYIGLKEYDGTIERAIALTLDHNIIFSKDNSFVLRDPKGGMDALTDQIKLIFDRFERKDLTDNREDVS